VPPGKGIAAARSGIETIFHCGPQLVEPDNLNRLLANMRHLGLPKTRVLEELLCSCDRATVDPDFSYTPIQLPVEHPYVEGYLEKATQIISCPNSLGARRFALGYAVNAGKTLFNVGVSCSDRALTGEVSVYWPDQPSLECPGCISLKGEESAGETPLFYSPLLVLVGAGLAITCHEFDKRRRPRQKPAQLPRLRCRPMFGDSVRGRSRSWLSVLRASPAA